METSEKFLDAGGTRISKWKPSVDIYKDMNVPKVSQKFSQLFLDPIFFVKLISFHVKKETHLITTLTKVLNKQDQY